MKVKFFAQLRSFAGCDEIDLPVEREIAADDLWAMLDAKFPGMARHKNSTRLAQNYSYAESDSVFKNDDEIALIPPVSGG